MVVNLRKFIFISKEFEKILLPGVYLLQKTRFLFCREQVFYFAGDTFFISQGVRFLFCRKHAFYFAGNTFFILQETCFLFCRKQVFYFAGSTFFILQETCFLFCRKQVSQDPFRGLFSKFREFRLIWTILRKLVPVKSLRNS